MKYACELCGMIYDEEAGDPKHGIPAGTAFSQLPQYYGCPACGSEKDTFSLLEKKAKTAAVKKDDAAFWKATKYSDEKAESER